MWMCDTEDNFGVFPIHEYSGEDGAHGFALSPDGSCAFHLEALGERVVLRKVTFDGKEEIVCEAPQPATRKGQAQIHTVSADGRRVLMGTFLGDGKTEGAPHGAYVFDVVDGTWWPVEYGNGFRNHHSQYSHSLDPDSIYDILVLGNMEQLSDGSWLTPPDGSWRWQDVPPDDGKGCFHNVLKDDGSDWRAVPVGRDESMVSGGHCTWRGREGSVIFSMYENPKGEWCAPLHEASPVRVSADELQLGRHISDSSYVDLTRNLLRPDSCHFGFDGTGKHFASDVNGYTYAHFSFVYVGTYHSPADQEPYVTIRFLLHPCASWKSQPAHPHPCLSPDGRFVLFQSDFSGRPQINLAFNFDYS